VSTNFVLMKIYHNPKCSKSRQTLQIIHEANKEVEIIEYLKTPPTFEELKSLIEMLGISPEQLLRKNEEIYKEQFKGKSYTNDEWIKIMAENPKLIERPIVVEGNKAVLGRPPENVSNLF
jgi:arsenate reductase